MPTVDHKPLGRGNSMHELLTYYACRYFTRCIVFFKYKGSKTSHFRFIFALFRWYFWRWCTHFFFCSAQSLAVKAQGNAVLSVNWRLDNWVPDVTKESDHLPKRPATLGHALHGWRENGAKWVVLLDLNLENSRVFYITLSEWTT